MGIRTWSIGMICLGLLGCAAEDESVLIEGLIQFPVLHSAYDGVHDYRVMPWLPSAEGDAQDPDPVIAESVRWTIDEAFVTQEPATQRMAAVMLTTRRAGETVVRVTAQRASGMMVRGEAVLKITQASAEDWAVGDERYHKRLVFEPSLTRSASVSSLCGLPFEAYDRIIALQPCSSCHDAANGVSLEYTPVQTALYADADLLAIFTRGAKPFGGSYRSAFLNMAGEPDCVFEGLHTWAIPEQDERGLVWKLRSLAPASIPDVDAARIVSE